MTENPKSIMIILFIPSRMSRIRFREHMDRTPLSERIAERKRRGEEEAARRRDMAEGLPESAVSLNPLKENGQS